MSVYVFIFSESGRKEWRIGTRLRGLRDVTQKSPDVKMHSQLEGESRRMYMQPVEIIAKNATKTSTALAPAVIP